ncbi:MAG TPA: flagellar basal body protein, partial [Acetobacteraceae bacterium]|nr:flagellar basal body protein [Acetobacteraceae bacterium]
MELTTYVALSRLTAQQRALDVTATNLANASTPGFKASRMLFSDWLSRQTGTDLLRGEKSVAYTQDRATYR